MKLGVIDILKLYGFNLTSRSKFVRHQDDRYPVDELRRHGWLELYQSYQGRSVFHKADQIVVFYGLAGSRAGFYGVYNVLGHKSAKKGIVLPECPWSEEWHKDAKFFYDLERVNHFDDIRDRLIIDWGKGLRSWVQNPLNKVLLEIQEPGRRLPPFDDYLEFSLTYTELKDLFANEEAHREWRARLNAVGGIYLILAETSGDLYVGSAYGVGGIWSRWREYARTGHAGNKKLQELIDADPSYPELFRFSILHVLPKTMARDDIIRREARYKDKLGTRAIGLNLN